MFMTGTYPAFILNSDDEPLVMGMHAAFIRPRFLRHDLFLKVEMEYPPMGDISPTYIATVSTNHFFLNLGVMLHRLIWAETRRPHPHVLIGSGWRRLIKDFVQFVGSGVMKLLIVDRRMKTPPSQGYPLHSLRVPESQRIQLNL